MVKKTIEKLVKWDDLDACESTKQHIDSIQRQAHRELTELKADTPVFRWFATEQGLLLRVEGYINA